MNWNFLITLLKGANVYETIVKILNLSAGFLAAHDPDHTGTDDLLAGCLSAVADGINAYAVKDNNEHGNIVDGLIAGLQKYRDEMVTCGKITTRVPVGGSGS
jgi:hypothetical protein